MGQALQQVLHWPVPVCGPAKFCVTGRECASGIASTMQCAISTDMLNLTSHVTATSPLTSEMVRTTPCVDIGDTYGSTPSAHTRLSALPTSGACGADLRV